MRSPSLRSMASQQINKPGAMTVWNMQLYCVNRKQDSEGQTVNHVWNKIRRRMQGPLKTRCSAAVFISVEKTPASLGGE